MEKSINSEIKDENINIIKRQTDYSEEVIKEKLKLHDNNIETIILEYNGIQKKDETEHLSTNQKIFKAIRDRY